MKNRKRRSAAVLAAGMSVLLGAGTITGATEQTDADNSIRKEETVYVNTEADGTIKEITVSEWLKNAKTLSDSTITDISDLSDIKIQKVMKVLPRMEKRLPGKQMEEIFIMKEKQRKIFQ